MVLEKTNSAFYEKAADDNNYLYLNKVICKKNVATSPHFHDSIEVVMAIRGKCGIRINGDAYVLDEGDCAFIDRFDVHYYEYFPDSEYYVFLVSKKYLDESNGFDKKRPAAFLPKCENYDSLKSLFDSTYRLWSSSNETFRRGLVNVILGALSGHYILQDREFKGETKALVDALLYINENYDSEITLELLSAKLGYSKTYFSSLFNKFAGMNLREYINRRRICEFERLRSQQPDMPVYAAAQECGFNSLKTFYRAYNKYNNEKS